MPEYKQKGRDLPVPWVPTMGEVESARAALGIDPLKCFQVPGSLIEKLKDLDPVEESVLAGR